MSATPIKHINAREILDSRGNPTLEVTVQCEGGIGICGVPSGASTGTHEAVERRDNDQSHFGGHGVRGAATAVNIAIADTLIGVDIYDQEGIDQRMIELDGTPNKSHLGGNALIGVSIACAKAAAAASNREPHEYLRTLAHDVLPSRRVPFLNMNLMNGGKHAATRLAFQEYKIVPQTDDISEALNIGTSIMHALKKRIATELGAVNANVGDEGGFAPDLDAVRKPLELFMSVAADLNLDHHIKLALDVAASSFYTADTDRYTYDGADHTAAELESTLRGIITDFPILYIEDPFNEDKFADFARLNADAGVIIVGDDLTVTNTEFLQKAINEKSISGIIIKPNQVGTLTETLNTMRLARTNGIECIVSHRSGETNDDFIADLAVATGAFGIKAGGPQRGERVAKYNRFLRIYAR